MIEDGTIDPRPSTGRVSMRIRVSPWIAIPAAFLLPAQSARAGMPSINLTEIGRLRFETISFFLVVFLLCACAIQGIWNDLRHDFSTLPRLSYRRACGLMALWGLLFLLVLTIISGARELMTPGAWKKDGLTYKLADPSPSPSAQDQIRWDRLEQLRSVLWQYARLHEGRFPARDSKGEIAEDAWRVPDPSGMHYLYEGGRADIGNAPLAYEPGIFGPERFVLLTNGEVRRMLPAELQRALDAGGR
jgi:hypothetical protein